MSKHFNSPSLKEVVKRNFSDCLSGCRLLRSKKRILRVRFDGFLAQLSFKYLRDSVFKDEEFELWLEFKL